MPTLIDPTMLPPPAADICYIDARSADWQPHCCSATTAGLPAGLRQTVPWYLPTSKDEGCSLPPIRAQCRGGDDAIRWPEFEHVHALGSRAFAR